MEISTISVSRMNNGAHFLYHTDFYNRILADTAVKEKIAEVMPRYKQAIDNEDIALKISQKSLSTDKIEANDKRRDSLFNGLKNIVRAQLAVSDPEIRDAAVVINQLIKDYSINVKDQLDKETGLLINFIDDLETKYAKEVEKLAIGTFIKQLKESNELVRNFTASRTEEVLAKPGFTLAEARKETDKVYKEVVKQINAHILLEGEDDYKNLVTLQNKEIVHYKQQVLKQSVPPASGDLPQPPKPDKPGGDDDDHPVIE